MSSRKQKTEIVYDGEHVLDVIIEDTGSEKYFTLQIAFPDGSFKKFYIGWHRLANTQDWTSGIKEIKNEKKAAGSK